MLRNNKPVEVKVTATHEINVKVIDAPEDDKRFEYLNASVTDIQGVIKAVDTKVGFLLVFLGIPISGLSKIYSIFVVLLNQFEFYWWKAVIWIYISLFIISWILSFITAVRVLTSIHNPNAHIENPPANHGSFFAGGLFRLTFWELFISRKKLKSTQDFATFARRSPQNLEQILSELIFEQMKLAYIRDIKIFRQNWAFIFTISWLIIGFIGQLTHLLTKKN